MHWMPALEICVDTVQGLDAAVAGTADRIELCSALALGGLTPGPGLIAAAVVCGVPCHVMIRPRAGDFVLRPGDLDVMRADIAAVKAAGMAGVVIGASRPDGTLDLAALNSLHQAAKGLHVTLHRAFDLTPDAQTALEDTVDLGISRILTSGQAATARQGAAMLERLVKQAAGRIEIMAGSGVSAQNAQAVLATGVNALHASCGVPDSDHANCDLLNIGAGRVTDKAGIASLRSAMSRKESPA